MSDAQAALLEKARQVTPGSFRHSVLTAARRFKAGWVELGRMLVRVRDEGLFQQWGFESFEGYCAKELHIRKATAEKLVRSYSFLSRHEPKALFGEDLPETAPAFEVVEVLAGAEERGQLSAQEYRGIRDSIWNPERSWSDLRRELSDRYRAPEGERTEAQQLRRLSAMAHRLAEELARTRKVPRAIAERAAALAEDVEELTAQQS
ncbi:MAG: hypothetical protein HYZ28_17300 [Myxococcales bacterium]|nr:hypothetical protein [Myxococcales bacterium]